MNSKLSHFFAALIAVVACMPLRAGPAAAQVTLSLSPASASAVPGQTVVYQGEIANETGSTIDLDGIDFSGSSSAYTTDASLFLSDTPDTLAAGQYYSGDLFSATVSNTAPAGAYSGEVNVVYGDGAGNETSSNFANFLVTVSPGSGSPGNMVEPPVWWLFSLFGLVAGIVVGLRPWVRKTLREWLEKELEQ